MTEAGRDARIVLYDGVCGFCHGSVRWLIDRDPAQRLRFAPLQGETAAGLRARHPEISRELDTIVFVEIGPRGERVWLRSAAVFRALRELRVPWRWFGLLRWVLPGAVWDVAYRAFASRRYRWFGRLETCPIPSPAVRARFLG